MTVPGGNVVYQLGAAPCTGEGRIWSTADLDSALDQHVAGLVFDYEGRADIESILSGLAETEFAQEGLQQVLSDPDEVEDWRVGEAIAEAYLSDHRTCCFPWPDGRDERKSGSNLPGADLVGFRTDAVGYALTFGEVKTSSAAHYPPNVMYGRTGLKQQLEDLRDQVKIRDDLLKYLCYRAKVAPWRRQLAAASRRYLQNKSDVYLYGVLVRDVYPNEDDLRGRVAKLRTGCPNGMNIELLALYLPSGRINGLGSNLVTGKTGGVS